jgi:SAM-dependent methyltransferase
LGKLVEKIIKSLVSKTTASGTVRATLRRMYFHNIVSSRIVEYPLALTKLNFPVPSKILDVGCSLSSLSLQMASIGHKVYGIDIVPYNYTHSNFSFFQHDARDLPFEDDFFDVVTAISTVEHIGLDFSFATLSGTGKVLDNDGDKKALKEIYRVLRKGGTLLISVPIGRWRVTPAHRCYDNEHLQDLLSGFKIKEVEYYLDDKEKQEWVRSDYDTIYSHDLKDDDLVGIAFVTATK